MENSTTLRPSCKLGAYLEHEYRLTFSADKVATFMQERCDSYGERLSTIDHEELLTTEFILDKTLFRKLMLAQAEERGIVTKRLSNQRFQSDGESFVIAHDIQVAVTSSTTQSRKHSIAMGFADLESDSTVLHTALSYGIESLLYDQLHPEHALDEDALRRKIANTQAVAYFGCIVAPQFLPGSMRYDTMLASAGTVAAVGMAYRSRARKRLNRERVTTIVQNVEEHSRYLQSWPIGLKER